MGRWGWCRGGMGPNMWGAWGTLNPLGLPRGIGWMIASALATGPKTEQEIREHISKITGIQISYSLEPVLSMWALRGFIRKREDGRYELIAAPPFGPFWAAYPFW